jgi:galactose mutarotase-like enzyme
MSSSAQQSGILATHLHALVLENELLRVVVLPETGGRIWQITYKPTSCDLLWNNPSHAPSRLAPGSSYDDNWSGGWDELFPNDEAAQFAGLSLPDHGELWTTQWAVDSHHPGPGTQELLLSCTTPVTRFEFEKYIRLGANASIFTITYKLTNRGDQRFPFLFKLHPAFEVEEGDRIDLPPSHVKLEPEFPGTLEGSSFEWPHHAQRGCNLDMRIVPAADSGALHFFYGTGLRDGWCAITRRKQNLSVALKFDTAVFSTCWLFATHGGWKDLNVAVLEPATGYPFRLQSMIENGQAQWLAPGESLSTEVLFAVKPGLKSIGGVDSTGAILPAAD